MKKLLKSLIIACLMAISLLNVSAEETYLFDDADYYSSEEESRINAELENISLNQDLNFVIITADEEYSDIEEASKKAYESRFGNEDALILYLSLANGEFCVLPYGDKVTMAITSQEIEYMMHAFIEVGAGDVSMIADLFIKNGEFYYVDDVLAKRDPLLVDEADLLSDSEEKTLISELEQASARVGVDIVIYTTDYDNGQAENMAAADFYDYHNYASEGYMLYINMATRRLFILTTGDNTRDAFSDYDLDSAVSDVGGYLSDGYYYDAMSEFIDTYDRYYYPSNPNIDLNERGELIVDDAALLNETQKVKLKSDLDYLSYEYDTDFIFVSTNEEIAHHYERDAANNYLNDHLYRYDAILLYVSVNENNPFAKIVASGSHTWNFDEDALASFEEELMNMILNGQTADAITQFSEHIFDYYTEDVPLTETEARHKSAIMMALIGASIVTAGIAFVLIRQMHSFGLRSNATDYSVNMGGFYSKVNLTRSNDIYLYRTTSRTHSPVSRPRSGGGSSFGGGSSSFSGSSGVSHGGSGGSF